MTVAAGAGTETDITTSTDSPSESSSADALSDAEKRDIETFARYGMNPDGSPKQPESKPEAAEADADDDEDAEAESTEADADDSDDDDATAVSDTEDDDEEVEITDEQLDRYVDALLELNADKITANPKIRERIEAQIREKFEQEYEARQRAASASQERERLTGQGRRAVESLASMLTTAQEGFAKATEELKKAEAGQEFNPAVISAGLGFDAQALQATLRDFSDAATFDVRRSHEDAFLTAFKAASAIGGPIAPEEVETIKSIVNTANRIEGDEKQGPERFDKAKEHYYGETVKFLTSRAFEAGKQAAIAEAKAKREARKAVLDADAVLAGAAKEAAKRGALPPSPTAPAGTSSGGEATIEAYRAAKAKGDFELADQIMQRMQASAPPEAQRRLRR